jgi:hypothetical protein
MHAHAECSFHTRARIYNSYGRSRRSTHMARADCMGVRNRFVDALLCGNTVREHAHVRTVHTTKSSSRIVTGGGGKVGTPIPPVRVARYGATFRSSENQQIPGRNVENDDCRRVFSFNLQCDVLTVVFRSVSNDVSNPVLRNRIGNPNS